MNLYELTTEYSKGSSGSFVWTVEEPNLHTVDRLQDNIVSINREKLALESEKFNSKKKFEFEKFKFAVDQRWIQAKTKYFLLKISLCVFRLVTKFYVRRKSLFRFRDQPVDRLRYDESFNRQCYVIQNFMRKTVGLLRRGEFEQLELLCRQVGRRHAHLTKVQFAGDWWPLFVSSTLDQLKPRCKSWCQNGGRSASWSSSGSGAAGGSNRLLAALFSQWPLRLGVHFSTTAMMIIGGRRTKFDEVMEAWRIFLEYVVTLMSNEFYTTRAEKTRFFLYLLLLE
uniref:Globin family profile domain-containing protein n=1 Tax=Romanomermis culicivorax TaxID=13658 RepID=A0A915IXH8_ROMCU